MILLEQIESQEVPITSQSSAAEHARPQITVPREQIADFCRRNHIRWLALFGSVLRDDFKPDSDVDVLVEFEPAARVTMFTLSRLQRELESIFARPVDFVLKDGLKRRIRASVLASAQVIYAN
jgi:predicted nucleotidyltransferase